MGLMAGPDRPPVRLASTGLRVSMSMTIAVNVLMRLRASAPASTAARAMTLISVTQGESLTMSTLVAGRLANGGRDLANLLRVPAEADAAFGHVGATDIQLEAGDGFLRASRSTTAT